jgi:ABC-type polysaccharide/polyol phosphate export permease
MVDLTIRETSKQTGPAPSSFISPAPGGPFAVAMQDIRDAFHYSPVWLHAGWVEVVWRFRRTRLGPFWHTLGLAVFVIVMGVIWSKVLKQDPVSYFQYVSTSLIIWSLISTLANDGTAILINGQYTVLAMRYPYIAFAFAHVWRSFLLFLHHAVLYAVIMVATFYNPGGALLLAIPGLLLVLANGVWVSLLFGMIGLRRRDFGPAVASGMQLLLFATPIFWQKDLLGAQYAWVSDYNPFYHLLNVVREPMLGRVPTTESWLWACGTLVLGTLATLWLYGRKRDRIVYWY